jgi:hypothetical protein
LRIRVNGGNHWFLHNVTFKNWGRDGLHLEPDSSFHWSENSVVDNLHLTLSRAASATLRDAINISLGNSSLASVFINDATWRSINIRGYKRNAIHFLNNNSCSGCKISSHTFIDTHTDSVGNAPTNSNAMFFEKGASCCMGPPNPIEAILFLGGGFEDTVVSPTAAAMSISASGLVSTVDFISFINGNFAGGIWDQAASTNVFGGLSRIGIGVNQNTGVYDFVNSANITQQSTLTEDSNNYLKLSSATGLRISDLGTAEYRLNNSTSDNEQQFWKDATPTVAAAAGLNVPGSALTNDYVISTFSGTWAEKGRVPNSGGYAWLEQAAPSAAGLDYDHCYGDSTLHQLKCSYNGGSFFPNVLTGNAGGTHSDSGFTQSKRSMAGCTTAASIGGTCAIPVTVTWPVAFADTNYSVSCQGTGIMGSVTAKSTTSITVQTMALTAAAASFQTIDCIAQHD